MALARGGLLPVATAARPPRISPSTASARQAPAARQQSTGRRASTAAAGFLAAAAVAAGARRRRPSTSRRPGRRGAGVRVALKAYEDDDEVGTLDPPSEQEMKEAFLEASGGTDLATLDEALDLEGIDEVIADGAISEEEMEVMWGDEDKTFEEWKDWYMEVFYIYDDFLTSSSVAPPAELMEDVQEELEAEDKYTDEELLEDSPTVGISVKQVLSDTQKRLEQEAGGVAAAAQPAAAPQQQGNFDVARLFKEGCDEDNLLSFDSFTVISDINEMLDSGEVTYGELKELWAKIPQKNGAVDILGFKALMAKVDELFEYEDEEEEEGKNEFKNASDAELLEDGDGLEEEEDEEEEVVPKAKTRPVDLIKANLKAQLQNLEDAEKKPMGLDGKLETDPLVGKLAGELEEAWRNKIRAIEDVDEKLLLGDWELLYSTSLKYRRWQGLMNSQRFIKDGVPEALTQTFEMDDEVGTKDYDVEEILIKDGKEVGIRAVGSWELGLSPNVVTGLDDIVIKLLLTGIEFDKTEEEEYSMPEEAERKLLQSQMVRTFSYTFLSYVDDEIMVCRTGYTAAAVFVFQRMGIED